LNRGRTIYPLPTTHRILSFC